MLSFSPADTDNATLPLKAAKPWTLSEVEKTMTGSVPAFPSLSRGKAKVIAL